MTLGRRLTANQKTFHIIKIQKMTGISKYYRTKLLKKSTYKKCSPLDLLQLAFASFTDKTLKNN